MYYCHALSLVNSVKVLHFFMGLLRHTSLVIILGERVWTLHDLDKQRQTKFKVPGLRVVALLHQSGGSWGKLVIVWLFLC